MTYASHRGQGSLGQALLGAPAVLQPHCCQERSIKGMEEKPYIPQVLGFRNLYAPIIFSRLPLGSTLGAFLDWHQAGLQMCVCCLRGWRNQICDSEILGSLALSSRRKKNIHEMIIQVLNGQVNGNENLESWRSCEKWGQSYPLKRDIREES